MPVTEYVTIHGVLVDLDDYNELCAENERLRGAGQDVFGVVTACHALLDERGYAVGSEFHGDLRRRVEWLTDSCRRGPKLHIENGRLREALGKIMQVLRDTPIVHPNGPELGGMEKSYQIARAALGDK